MKQTNPHNPIVKNIYRKFREYCSTQSITLASQVNPIDIATFKVKYNVASSDIRELQSSLDLCFTGDDDVHEHSKIIVSDETPDADKTFDNDPDIHVASKAHLSGDNDFDASIEPRPLETPSQRIPSFPNTIDIDSPIELLGLSRRSWNALIASGLLKISDIIDLNIQDLYEIRNLGKKSVAEIINVINQLNQMFPKYDTSQNSQTQISAFPRRSKKMTSLTERILATGVSPKSEMLELSEVESGLLQIVFNNMSTIGIELSNRAYYSPETIAPIFGMLGEYIRYQGKEKQLNEEFKLIPEVRMNKRLQHYISATGNKQYGAELNSLNTVDEVKNVFFEVCKDKETFDILLKFLRFLRTDYVESVSSLMQKAFDDASDPRSQNIVRQRELGMTLEAIGREEGITRERIRQIEARVMKKLSNYMTSIGFDVVAVVYAERDGDSYLTYDEVAEYYKNVENIATFMRLITDPDLYTSNAFEYSKYSEAFLRSDAENDLDRVMKIVDNFPRMVLQGQLNALFEGSSQRASISVEMLKDEFSRRYKLTGEVYHTGQLTLTEIYKFIMERYYPSGIKLYDAQEMSKFRKHIHDIFGDVALPDNNRAIDTRVADVSILCDRGMYIHSSYVRIDQALISEIFDYIFESDKTAISFHELYEMFKGKLLLNSNISNRYFLQGILKYHNNADLYFSRDYLSKEQGVNIDNEIEEFINRHDITYKAEVFATFPGLTEIMLNVRAAAIEDVLVLDNGRYMHADRLDIRPDDYSIKTELDLQVRSLPVSSRKILAALSLTHLDFLIRNGIDDHSKLFAVIKYMFPEEYVYSRPFIAPIGAEDISNSSVIKQYLSSYDKISITDVRGICDANHIQYGVSLRKLIQGINDEFLRIDADLLSRYDASSLNDNVLSDIGNALDRMLGDKGYIAAKKISDYLFFPPIGFSWNAFVLRSILERYFVNAVEIIDIPTTDTFAMNSIFIDADWNIEGYEDLIRRAIRTEHDKELFAGADDVMAWLNDEGLYNGHLPKCLTDESIFYVDEYGQVFVQQDS